MRRALFILFLISFFSAPAYSKIITFQKCYFSPKQQSGYKWNEKDHLRYTTSYLKDIPSDGNFNPNNSYNEHPWEDHELTKVQQWLSQGYKKTKLYDTHSISINLSNNVITHLREYTDENVSWERQRYFAMSEWHKRRGEVEAAKLYWQKENPKIETVKYKISSYADNIIIADSLQKPFDTYIGKNYRLIVKLKEGFFRLERDFASGDAYIYCNPFSGGQGSGSSGTAFFINNEGNLVTNHHVVSGCSDLKINYKKKEYKAKLLNSDEKLDIAVVKVDVKPDEYIKLSKNNPTKLQNVYAAGYPLGKGLSDDLKITSGIISSIKGNKDNINQIQIDAALNPGSSGGPIINQDGYLVGIAVSGMSKDKTESINFGIKSTSLEQYLNVNEIAYKKPFAEFSISKDRVLGMLEKATVYISCN